MVLSPVGQKLVLLAFIGTYLLMNSFLGCKIIVSAWPLQSVEVIGVLDTSLIIVSVGGDGGS